MSEEKDLGGRPTIEIDFNQLDQLIHIQCTGEECASVLGVSYDTIDRRLKEKGYAGFADYFGQKAGTGRASLRRKQWKQAEAGNATMLIWLGKQYLGQTDPSKFEISGNPDKPLNISTVELVAPNVESES